MKCSCEWILQGDCGENSERKKENCKESFCLLREYLHSHEQNTGRNMHGKGQSDKVSDRNEEHVIGKWRKDNPCYKVAEN